MSVLLFLIPLAGILVLASILAFRWASADGQFDDLTTPAVRILIDDEEAS